MAYTYIKDDEGSFKVTLDENTNSFLRATNWINTNEFRREAIQFEKTGFYTDAPGGSKDFFEYWDLQTKYCKEGFSAGGLRISGPHYNYLNFSQIRLTEIAGALTEEQKRVIQGGGRIRGRKSRGFPLFYDGDALFFLEFELAQSEGKHFLVVKARRKGFSYKAGVLANNQFQFYKESRTIFCAYEQKFLTQSGAIFTMCKDNVNFFNENTAWNKALLINAIKETKSGYLEQGTNIVKGYKSSLITLTFKNNDNAARGKDGDLVIMEEIGAWPNLIDSFKASRSIAEDGIYSTGTILAFGTGGKDAQDWEDAQEMFNNPDLYNIKGYDNYFSKESSNKIAFYFPNYLNKPGFMDEDGNSDIEGAIASDLKERLSVESLGNAEALVALTTEYSHFPEESFTIISNNPFASEGMNLWLAELENTDSYKQLLKHGRLANIDGEVKLITDPTIRPIDKWPLKNDKSHGCVTIIYPPQIDRRTNKVYDDVYFAVHDPYRDDNEVGESMAVTLVFSRPNRFTTPHNTLVAYHIGRPVSHELLYQEVFELLKMYNCKVAVENEILTPIYAYAKTKKLLHYLVEEFSIFNKKETNALNRKYGYSMGSKQAKMQGALYLKDWLYEVRGTTTYGSPIYNYHSIFSPIVIKSLLRYNSKTNNDIVSALMGAMFYMQNLYAEDEIRLSEPNQDFSNFVKKLDELWPS